MIWTNFFNRSDDLSLLVLSAYDGQLVALSVLIAIAAAVLSLHVVGVAQRAVDARLRSIAVTSGALVLGVGVWSMHFIGMLALRLCATVSYDLPLTLASVLPGLFAAWVALRLLIGTEVSNRQLAVSGVLVGAGIGAMHYLGSPRFQCNNWRYAKLALARGWCW
jgi:NO-binding membrane sensor protein with MHYT domain